MQLVYKCAPKLPAILHLSQITLFSQMRPCVECSRETSKRCSRCKLRLCNLKCARGHVRSGLCAYQVDMGIDSPVTIVRPLNHSDARTVQSDATGAIFCPGPPVVGARSFVIWAPNADHVYIDRRTRRVHVKNFSVRVNNGRCNMNIEYISGTLNFTGAFPYGIEGLVKMTLLDPATHIRFQGLCAVPDFPTLGQSEYKYYFYECTFSELQLPPVRLSEITVLSCDNLVRIAPAGTPRTIEFHVWVPPEYDLVSLCHFPEDTIVRLPWSSTCLPEDLTQFLRFRDSRCTVRELCRFVAGG